MTASMVRGSRVIDTDAHIVEPPELFLNYVPKRFHDDPDLPHVVVDPATGDDTWCIGGELDLSIGVTATAGWPQFFPDRPRQFAEIADDAAWNSKERLVRMDEYGLQAQILYANIGAFASWLRIRDPQLRLACVRAYNDFALDWSSADPQRLIPMMGLPFWDIEACISEMNRCAELGYRGIFFGSRPDFSDLPRLTDTVWDPIWEAANELNWPLNFHVGVNNSVRQIADNPANGVRANTVKDTLFTFLTNAHLITDLIISGMCHRFPYVNWVSVESGAGYVPYILDALDWQWSQCDVRQEHPEYELTPSEYFRRQIYCTFWFETETALKLAELIGPDNLMYETDFPHPTSMTPGPGSVAEVPSDFLKHHFARMSDEVFHKIVWANGARLYQIS